jgi:hypothetical protein
MPALFAEVIDVYWTKVHILYNNHLKECKVYAIILNTI